MVKILIMICLLSFYLQAEDRLNIITCECAPLTYSVDGTITGPAVDILKAIQNIIGSTDELNVYPWARSYIMLAEHSNVVLFSTAKTVQRESRFKWVGPIAEKKYSFFATKAASIKVDNFEEIKKYHIGVHIGSNNEQLLASKGFKKLYSSSSEKENLGKLLLGQIDLWLTDEVQAEMLMNNISRRDLIEKVFTIENQQLYFAFSKDISDEVIQQWQKALDSLYQDGVIAAIYAKYNLSVLYPQ